MYLGHGFHVEMPKESKEQFLGLLRERLENYPVVKPVGTPNLQNCAFLIASRDGVCITIEEPEAIKKVNGLGLTIRDATQEDLEASYRSEGKGER